MANERQSLAVGVAALAALSVLVLSAYLSSDHYSVLMMGPLTREYFDNFARNQDDARATRTVKGQILSSVDSNMFYASEEDHRDLSSRLPMDRPDKTPILVQSGSKGGKADLQSLVQDVTGVGGDFAAAAHWNSNRLPEDRPDRPKASASLFNVYSGWKSKKLCSRGPRLLP